MPRRRRPAPGCDARGGCAREEVTARIAYPGHACAWPGSRVLDGFLAGLIHAAVRRARQSGRQARGQPPQHRIHGGRGDRQAARLCAVRRRFQGVATEGTIGREKVLLLLPGTYMNESGRAVAEAMHFYKMPLGDIVVFHDEIEFAARQVRVKTGGGIAGHNGLRSISAHVGNDYRRVRIGVGHPGVKDLVYAHGARRFRQSERPGVETPLRRDRRQCRAARVGRRIRVSRTGCISPCRPKDWRERPEDK